MSNDYYSYRAVRFRSSIYKSRRKVAGYYLKRARGPRKASVSPVFEQSIYGINLITLIANALISSCLVSSNHGHKGSRLLDGRRVRMEERC